jgi:hypothetical protein
MFFEKGHARLFVFRRNAGIIKLCKKTFVFARLSLECFSLRGL